jgi:deoxyadenosine/deoxycytidine kinase
VIIWMNGPFGGGKTETAEKLLERIPHAILFDPEAVGIMLRAFLPDREPDFQDLPPWRPLVAATAAELVKYTEQPLITPMSLLREDYAKEIFTAITAHGIAIHHIVLHTDPDTLRQRITLDETHSEQAQAFRLSKIDAYQHAYTTWLRDAARVIDTTPITPTQIAIEIAAHVAQAAG